MQRLEDRRVSLALVLGATLITLALGFLLKSPCLGPWDGRQYTRLCYSDIVPLFSAEGLDRELIPYLEADNEYPVLTGLSMALAGIPADDYPSFFWWNALMLTSLALVAAAVLHRLVGLRALYFAAAPTLLIHGFTNWDLVAVALSVLGTWAFLRRRDGPAGFWLGLGAAAKLFPGLLAAPFALQRLRERHLRGALLVAGGAAAAWAAVNVPFMLAAPERWSLFFRFNSERPADWDSLWFLAQRHIGWPASTGAVNVLSALAFAASATLVWTIVRRVRPGFPIWTFGFPLLVVFLLTGKVYSPQFSLWLLPWFALTLPNPWIFGAFSAAEAAVFFTRFRFFAEMDGLPGGVPFVGFEVALLARAAVLVWALVAWVRGGTAPVERRPEEAPAEVAA